MERKRVKRKNILPCSLTRYIVHVPVSLYFFSLILFPSLYTTAAIRLYQHFYSAEQTPDYVLEQEGRCIKSLRGMAHDM